jgi:putative membrane protein
VNLETNQQLASRAPESATARRVIALLTGVVVLAVAAVLYVVPRHVAPRTDGPDSLATLNAVLNGASAVGLLIGYVAIKRKRIALHRASMLTSFGLSSVFLITYLLHHARVGSVPFRGTGWIRSAYFGVLIPHVLLAAVIVPLALITIRRGWVNDIAHHRPIARRTLPLWLYVSISGVVLYFMLYW